MENEVSKDSITAAELTRSLTQSPGRFFLIDLMSKEDFAASHVPDAVNIPMEELENHLSEIPTDKTIVVTCKRGLMKSDMALGKLQKAGYTNSVKLEGGINEWLEFQTNH